MVNENFNKFRKEQQEHQSVYLGARDLLLPQWVFVLLLCYKHLQSIWLTSHDLLYLFVSYIGARSKAPLLTAAKYSTRLSLSGAYFAYDSKLPFSAINTHAHFLCFSSISAPNRMGGINEDWKSLGQIPFCLRCFVITPSLRPRSEAPTAGAFKTNIKLCPRV